MGNHDLLERAFTADSGMLDTIPDLRGALHGETYMHEEIKQLAGPTLPLKLRARIGAATSWRGTLSGNSIIR